MHERSTPLGMVRDSIRRVLGELAARLDSDALAVELGSPPGSPEELRQLSEALQRRALVLRDYSAELLRASRELSDLAHAFPYTGDGWPYLRALVNDAMAVSAGDGLGVWLRELLEATSLRRLHAMERLCGEEVAMPQGSQLLVDRAQITLSAVRDRRLDLALPLLEKVIVGGLPAVRLRDEVLRDLALLLARLAVFGGDDQQEDRWLQVAAEYQGSAGEVALIRAWSARKRDSWTDARDHLENAQSLAPGTLGVGVELIQFAKHQEEAADDSAQMALTEQVAGNAVSSLANIAAIELEVDRLVEPEPVELWFAVARRAIREGEAGLAHRALDRAEKIDSSHPTRATIYELRAAATEAGNGPVADLASDLAQAGRIRLWANEADKALPLLERAFDLDVDHSMADLPLNLAEALRVVSYPRSLPAAASDLDRGVELVDETFRRNGVTPSTAWGYAVVALIEEQVAKGITDKAGRAGWRGLRSAARAVLHEPAIAHRWAALSRAANTGLANCMVSLAREAATVATIHSSNPAGFDWERASTLANFGDFEAVVNYQSSLTDDGDRVGLRAYVDFHKARFEPVVLGLAPYMDVEDRSWVWQVWLVANTIIRAPQVREYASKALELALDDQHKDEASWVNTGSMAALILGDYSRGLEIAERLLPLMRVISPEMDLPPCRNRGFALLLHGDRHQGIRQLTASLSMLQSPREVDEWRDSDRPFLSALAEMGNVQLPNLEHLDAVARSRRKVLEERSDALDEIGTIEYTGPDKELVANTKRLLQMVTRLGRGQLPARDELEEFLEYENEAAAVSEAISRKANEIRAGSVLLSLGEGRDAKEAIRELLESSPDTDQYLNRTHLAPEEVNAILTGLESDPEVGEAARSVLRAKTRPEAAEIQSLKLHVPDSWFEGQGAFGIERQLSRLFNEAFRFLPRPEVEIERMERSAGAVYSVWRGDEELEHGECPTGWRYFRGQPSTLLADDEDVGTVRPTGVPGWFQIPDTAVAPGSILELASADPEEYVALRAASAARER